MSALSPEWWDSLHHEGLLIAPGKLVEYFGAELEPLERSVVDRLRRDLTRLLDDESHLGACLDTVLEELLGLDRLRWRKANQVGSNWSHPSISGGAIRPRRLWEGPRDEILPVFTIEREPSSLRIGRGRRETSRVIEWLRKADRPLALLTNGVQLRLIHAGPDYFAYCDWDLRMWFEEGQPGLQVTALRQLLRREVIKRPKDDEQALLHKAIVESRRAQGELSAVLGERVRQAVEKLIQESNKSLEPALAGQQPVASKSIYIAAVRLVMRMVVVLFGEARDMLPRKESLYHGSYGLQGLHEQLERAAGGHAKRLGSRYGAWPRILGLFRLIHEGSHHEDLLIQRYGGGLFRPGDPDSDDPVARALARFEHHRNALSDQVVYEILRLLTRSEFKVRQGRGNTWVPGPVNFATLDTEYIGILYEGLLDYELRRAPSLDPIVFLSIGDEPALPFSRLDEMTVAARKQLFEKFGKKAKKAGAEEGEEEAEEAEGEDQAEEQETCADEPDAEDEQSSEELDDVDRWHRNRVHDWARNAVRDAGWTKKGADLEDPEVVAAAKRLVARVVLPEQWYLVRWGGTRKGSGTFYTPPQLARPTTRRTLQPLAYEPVNPREDSETGLVEVDEWVAKTPEQILKLKVCDPAMGSGSFLVAALDFLTDALFESLHVHGRLEPKSDHTIVRLADGQASNDLRERSLPVPIGHDEFEPRLRAQLKRHVVERCIYGVDLDPLAVELARMSLWVETMDPGLPFEFLDHKIKCGNALVGAWRDRLMHYPVAAWERDGGDKDHNNPVNHFKEVAQRAKGGATTMIKVGDCWHRTLAEYRIKVKANAADADHWRVQEGFSFRDDNVFAEDVLGRAREIVKEIDNVPLDGDETKAALYAKFFLESEDAKLVRSIYDAWCALWFWPVDDLAAAPLPTTYGMEAVNQNETVSRIAGQWRFFHWEFEFPDVFGEEKRGFDAILMNPPWETVHKQSVEFFSNHDPLYRMHEKEAVGAHESALFERAPEIEEDWLRYCARVADLSNWVANLKTGESHSRYYRVQGKGRPYTFRLFLELATCLVSRDGGSVSRIGAIVPSSMFSDKNSAQLRRRFLEDFRWSVLIDFENREQVFAIHRSARFSTLVVDSRGPTKVTKVAFMMTDVTKFERAMIGSHGLTLYPSALIYSAAPESLVLTEFSSSAAFDVMTRCSQVGGVFGTKESGEWRARYGREFNMSDDAGLFRPVPHFVGAGYAPGKLGLLWRKGEFVVPLLEGRMVSRYHCFSSRWKSGRGRSAKWSAQEVTELDVGAQFYFPPELFLESSHFRGDYKVAVMDVTGVTNTRTIVASCAPRVPSGHTVNVASSSGWTSIHAAGFAGIMNSLVFDCLARRKLAGQHVTRFFLSDLPFPLPGDMPLSVVGKLVLSLNAIHPLFATWWRNAEASGMLTRDVAARAYTHKALTVHERARVGAMVEAVIAHAFNQSVDSFGWIVRECDYPAASLRQKDFRKSLEPRGFWRVDKKCAPELRHTVLSLVAFHDLQRMGLRAFLDQNDAEGWMLPKTLRLADYGLGHDDRAKEHQPVAEVLGSRFFDWQLNQSVEESWEECERHAELLEQILPLPKPANAAEPEQGQLAMFGAADPQPAKKKRATKKKKSS